MSVERKMNTKVLLAILISVLLPACTLRFSTTVPPIETISVPPSAIVETEPIVPTVVTREPYTPVVAATKAITETATVTATLSINPTKTAMLAPAPTPTPRFMVQAGTPVDTANFVHPEAGCNWMGVAGQVFGQDEKPIEGLVVEVAGILGNEPVLSLALTGGSAILGPGGYEITLADQPIASMGTLWVQLFDLNSNPQSEKIIFNTYDPGDECNNNLIVINFNEVGLPMNQYYLPVILK
jgi:hypothetical protein